MFKGRKPLRSAFFLLVVALGTMILGSPAGAQEQALAEDRGLLHFYQLLAKLHTTARLMQTTAHPDDEDGGMLTLEARGHGDSVLLFTLNRGEGGQNKFGSESSDELGILRTLELLKAGEYYGVQQRFSRVVDFGFSKTAEETFEQWGGHDTALGDLVRVIRTFHPDVLSSRFLGTDRDGHGHHQAAGILTREAFRAAGDPARFPEQIKEGLLPWQPQRLYVGNVRQNEDYSVRFDTGQYSPILGMSYAQFALEGLAHQTSQGTGGVRIGPGHRYTYYQLADGVQAPANARQEDFFDGIDTSLSGLAARLGGEEKAVPFLREALKSLEADADRATALISPSNPERAAQPLLHGVNTLASLLPQIERAQLSPSAKSDLLLRLRDKQDQFFQAADEALGLIATAQVDADPPVAPNPNGFPRAESTFQFAIPGQSFTVTARLYNRGSGTVEGRSIQLQAPAGWSVTTVKSEEKSIGPGDAVVAQFKVVVPADAADSRPYWHRENQFTQSVYTIDQSQYGTFAFPPPPLRAIAKYAVAEAVAEVGTTVNVKAIDPALGQVESPLLVAPALSVQTEMPVEVFSIAGHHALDVAVNVRSNQVAPIQASLRLQAPAGWSIEPATHDVQLDHEGDANRYVFRVTPQSISEQGYPITAIAESGGKTYSEGMKMVNRADLGALPFYAPARERIQVVDVKLPAALKVGYIMGAGDYIPDVLGKLGVDVQLISPAELATGDLSKYHTIVLGIRAYDVRTDVREQNRRLLEFARNGGTLLVQYNQTVAAFNAGHYTPYPMTASQDRVTVEQAPVQILAPASPVFHYPNVITAHDFDGWVQERGLYFLNQWDPHFTPLLSSHDPGEAPLDGGLVVAQYGKGTYIFSAYGFSRQLPAGVPGAVRLFVNLLALDQSQAR